MKVIKSADKRSILLKEFARGIPQDEQNIFNPGCLVYTRVSSKQQHDTNHSLETQLSAILKYVEQHQLTILKQFGHTYESAKSDSERKEFQKMIAYAKKHENEIGQILVYSFDRWSRSGVAGAYLASELKALGIQLISVSQPTDLKNPSGDLMKNMLLIFSEHDNALRREKSVQGTKNRLKKGLPSGTPPRGYSTAKEDGEKIVVPNSDAKFIKKIFKLKVYEQKTNARIAEIINAQGFNIFPRSISKVLANPFYAGYISNKLLEGEIVKGKHKALVSEADFLKANSDIKKIDFRTRKTEINPNLPLKNMIWCERCNRGHLTGYLMKKRNIWYYKCSRSCKTNRNAEVIHGQFKSLLAKFYISPNHANLLKKELQQTFESMQEEIIDDKVYYKKELNEVNSKLARVQEKFINDEILKDVYDSYSEKLVKEQVRLENLLKAKPVDSKSELNQFIDFAFKLAQDLVSIWEEGDVQSKINLAKLVFPMGVRYDRKRDTLETVSVNDALMAVSKLKENIDQDENLELPIDSFLNISSQRFPL